MQGLKEKGAYINELVAMQKTDNNQYYNNGKDK